MRGRTGCGGGLVTFVGLGGIGWVDGELARVAVGCADGAFARVPVRASAWARVPVRASAWARVDLAAAGCATIGGFGVAGGTSTNVAGSVSPTSA